jgi:copper chaperone CopZ
MQTLALTVAGMDCSGCEQRIQHVVGRLEGVRRVTADHQRGQVQVVLDPATVTPAAVQAAIEQAGYTVARDGDGEAAR